MEFQVVPPFAVQMTPSIAVVPQSVNRTTTEEKQTKLEVERRPSAVATAPASKARARSVVVTVSNNTNGPVNATTSIHVPAGWTVAPRQRRSKFERPDEQVTTTFTVTPPALRRAPAGRGIQAVVSAQDVTSQVGYQVVEYPHIRRCHVVKPAETRVKVIDVGTPGLLVGYVMGSATRCRRQSSSSARAVQLLECRRSRVGRSASLQRHRHRRARLRTARRSARQQQPTAGVRVQRRRRCSSTTTSRNSTRRSTVRIR